MEWISAFIGMTLVNYFVFICFALPLHLLLKFIGFNKSWIYALIGLAGSMILLYMFLPLEERLPDANLRIVVGITIQFVCSALLYWYLCYIRFSPVNEVSVAGVKKGESG